MLVFAFGSNLDPEQMARRCPESRFVAIARMPDTRLAFSRYSATRAGGVADVVPTPDHEVWGVLWELNEADLATLDGFEGYVPGGAANGYEREWITVESSEGEVGAWVYRANQEPNPPLPHRDYVKHLIDGARAHGLPKGYQAMLANIKCAE